MSPRLLLNLLWLPLAVVAVIAFRQSGSFPNRTTHPVTHSDVLQFKSGGRVLGFAPDALYVVSGSQALRVEFVNSHKTAPVGAGTTDGAQPVAQLSRVTYPSLWEGISLTYDAPSGAIVRSTYRIEAQADPGNIHLRYNAPVAVQDDGSVRVSFQNGTVNESAPQAWQERNGKQVPVRVAFALCGNTELTFAVGEYDRNEPLFIDPTLTWNTFLGGTSTDETFGLALDGLGNIYVAGYSMATWGSPITAYNGGAVDAFVAKLDSNGNLVWNTFLGGGGIDEAFKVALDGAGNIYLVGYSNANWGSPVRAYSGDLDAFAAKLDANGNLIWNTFLGSGAFDVGRAVAVDATGNVAVTGYCSASWGSPVRAFTGGALDAFVAKLDPSGNLVWNTFLGGSGTDDGKGVAIDLFGNVLVTGNSNADWGSPILVYAGNTAAFVAKLDAGGAVTWSTFLSGGVDESGEAVTVDLIGNVYVAGQSQATWGSPINPFIGIGSNAFAAKLDPSGTLVWNTFFGSGSADSAEGVTLDGSGNLFLTGFSDATWGSPARAHSGSFDAFAAELDPNGTLTWNTFLGGDSMDFAYGVAADGSDNVLVSGYSETTWGSPIRPYGGGPWDVFVAKVHVEAPTPTPTPSASPTATPSPTPTPTPTATPIPTPSFQGSFVIGDGNAVVGNRVTFWGDQWATSNSLSGGPAPAGFKGFANVTTPNPAICGGTWKSKPGNSSAPPSSVPPFIAVIVTSSITQSGSTISGNIPRMVIIQTDPGYDPNPGHSGTGTVVGVICP